VTVFLSGCYFSVRTVYLVKYLQWRSSVFLTSFEDFICMIWLSYLVVISLSSFCARKWTTATNINLLLLLPPPTANVENRKQSQASGVVSAEGLYTATNNKAVLHCSRHRTTSDDVVRCRCNWTHWFDGGVHIPHDVVRCRAQFEHRLTLLVLPCSFVALCRTCLYCCSVASFGRH